MTIAPRVAGMVHRCELLDSFDWLAGSEHFEDVLDEALVAIAFAAHGHLNELVEYGSARMTVRGLVEAFGLEDFVRYARADISEGLTVASLKTPIIEKLFFDRYDPESGALTDEIVTLDQVTDAIRLSGDLSPRNPANFMKDIVRSRSRNELFPAAVVQAGWTAIQDPGESNCFRFVPLPPGQSTAFVTNEPDAVLLTNPHPVQSLSLPPASRTFGRSDETWLTHVVTNLDIVHTHLGLHSPLDLLGLELLQSNVKLGKAEVDAVYLGTLNNGTNFLVSCEMKGPREELDLDQIERGARQVHTSSAAEAAFVVPLGVQALRGGLIWIVEFARDFPPLAKASEGVYRPVPSVGGIG